MLVLQVWLYSRARLGPSLAGRRATPPARPASGPRPSSRAGAGGTRARTWLRACDRAPLQHRPAREEQTICNTRTANSRRVRCRDCPTLPPWCRVGGGDGQTTRAGRRGLNRGRGAAWGRPLLGGWPGSGSRSGIACSGRRSNFRQVGKTHRAAFRRSPLTLRFGFYLAGSTYSLTQFPPLPFPHSFANPLLRATPTPCPSA